MAKEEDGTQRSPLICCFLFMRRENIIDSLINGPAKLNFSKLSIDLAKRIKSKFNLVQSLAAAYWWSPTN